MLLRKGCLVVGMLDENRIVLNEIHSVCVALRLAVEGDQTSKECHQDIIYLLLS